MAVNIVIVNDCRFTLKLLSDQLEKNGYSARCFSEPLEALNHLATFQLLPDLIITDIHMPAMNGWQLCRTLRTPEYGPWNQVPILVVSATLRGEEISQLTAESGANAFLAIPFDKETLLRTVHRLLAGKSSYRPNHVLLVDDCSVVLAHMAGLLESQSYQVEIALSGEEARHRFYQSKYELVVMDYHLPDMTGDQLLVEFQRHAPECAVIMITANPDQDLSIRLMRLGASSYLRKPIDPQKFLFLCRRVLQEKAMLESLNILEKRSQKLRENEAFLKNLLQLNQLAESPLEEILDFAMQSAIQTTGSRSGCLALLHENESLSKLTCFPEASAPDKPGEGKEVRCSGRSLSFWQETLKRRSAWTGETEASHEIQRREPSSPVRGRFLNLPIFCGTSIVAVLEIRGKESDYESDDIQRLTLLGENLWRLVERKRHSVALEEREAMYRQLFEMEANALLFSDAETLEILDANSVAETLFGYSRAELTGMTCLELSAQPKETLHVVKNTTGFVPLRWYKKRDGTLFPGEVTISYFRWRQKRVGLATVRDITERLRTEQELQQSQANLSALIESTNDLIWSVDLHHALVTHNSRFQQYLKQVYGSEARIGAGPQELFGKGDAGKWDLMYDRAVAEGPYRLEFKMPDGMILELFFHPIVQNRGPAGVSVFGKDISKRKLAEEARQESEARYQLLFESAKDAILMIQRHRFIGCNPAALTLFGCRQEDLIGETPVRFSPERQPNGNNSLSEVKRRIMRALFGISESFEWQHRRLDGTLFDVEVSLNRVDLGGECVVQAILRDITERKKAEQAQQENEQRVIRQRAAIAALALDDSIAAGDITLGLARINQVLSEALQVERCSVWRLSEDESELQCLSICCHREVNHNPGMRLKASEYPGYFTAIRAHNLVSAADALQEPATREFRESYLEPLGIRSLLDAGIQMESKLIGLICLEHVGEIRRWRLDEEAFVGTAAAIVAQLFSNMNRRQAEAEREKLKTQLIQAQKMESIGRLAGGVAHDFNNMLGVILGHTEMALLRSDRSSPIRSGLKEIRIAAQRSADLTRQLLAFARKQTIAPKVLDLNHTVVEMKKMLQRIIGEDVDLIWKPGADLWPIRMDPSQVDQILANLCANARDAIAGVGWVLMETGNVVLDVDYCIRHVGSTPGEYVALVVSDNGCGMSKETMAHLFEPFFTTKEVGKGTGLGLATIYGVVKQNGGFIQVYSEPGQGTSFKIYIPRCSGASETAPAEGPVGLPTRGHETILLVEDEPAILDLCKSILESLGYHVIPAGTPLQALQLAEKYTGKIQLLITDIIMPQMNGKDLADKLVPLHSNLRHLMMSGYTANVIANKGILDDSRYFLQKPFSINKLAAKVREVLDAA